MCAGSFTVKLRIFEAIHVKTNLLVLFVRSFDYISYYHCTIQLSPSAAQETIRLKMLMPIFSPETVQFLYLRAPAASKADRISIEIGRAHV